MTMDPVFHIYASRCETRFVMRGLAQGLPRVFPSLFEAALFARTRLDCEKGLVVIHDQRAGLMNCIPFVSKRGTAAVAEAA